MDMHAKLDIGDVTCCGRFSDGADMRARTCPPVVETVTVDNDYEILDNLPSIEGVTLVKDKTFEQLGLTAMTPQEIDDMLFGL